MKRLLRIFLLMWASSALAAGVHVDDIEYQNWLNKLVPEFTSVIKAVELGKNAADEVDAVLNDTTAGQTIPQFCAVLFPTSGTTTCDTAGEEHYEITDSLVKLKNALTQMYNCGTNNTCAAQPRLERIRRHTNQTLRVQLDADASQYQPMFDMMVSQGRNLLNALLKSNIMNELADQVESTKTDLQLCQQFYPGATCVADTPLSRTQDLKSATGAMDSLFDCASNTACGTDTRLTKMRQFVEIQ